jgi:hypothetical protein
LRRKKLSEAMVEVDNFHLFLEVVPGDRGVVEDELEGGEVMEVGMGGGLVALVTGTSKNEAFNPWV